MATESRRQWRILFGGLAVIATAGVAAEPAPLVLVHGPRQDVRATGIVEDRLVYRKDGEAGEVPLEQVVSWGAWTEVDHGPYVVLTDGTILPGEIVAWDAGRVQLTTRRLGPWSLPLPKVAGMVVRSPADRLAHDRLLQDLLRHDRAHDTILLSNGDRLEGPVRSAGEAHLAAGFAALLVGDSPLRVERENLVAVFHHAQLAPRSDPVPPSMWIGLTDGSRLAVRAWKQQGEQLTIQLQNGVSHEVPVEQLWQQVTWIAPAATTYRFVSDLPTAGYKHVPVLTLDWPLGLDRNVRGGALRGAGRWYAKGLGMHTAARSAYTLSGKYRWFAAELAVDDLANRRGSVIFRVYVDRGSGGGNRSSPWELKYESPTIRGGESPLPVQVDIAGAERMALVVDHADRGDEADYANWLQARVVP